MVEEEEEEQRQQQKKQKIEQEEEEKEASTGSARAIEGDDVRMSATARQPPPSVALAIAEETLSATPPLSFAASVLQYASAVSSLDRSYAAAVSSRGCGSKLKRSEVVSALRATAGAAACYERLCLDMQLKDLYAILKREGELVTGQGVDCDELMLAAAAAAAAAAAVVNGEEARGRVARVTRQTASEWRASFSIAATDPPPQQVSISIGYAAAGQSAFHRLLQFLTGSTPGKCGRTLEAALCINECSTFIDVGSGEEPRELGWRERGGRDRRGGGGGV